jgi:hypothetical protein
MDGESRQLQQKMSRMEKIGREGKFLGFGIFGVWKLVGIFGV